MKGFNLGGLHYRLEFVRCGKKTCRTCPHGPYWYAYHYLKIFMTKTYIGKKLPAEVEAARERGEAKPAELPAPKKPNPFFSGGAGRAHERRKGR